MSCQETQQSLSLYVDDQLALVARAACNEHLQSCPICRAELQEIRNLRRSLSALSSPTPPADLASSIRDALAIEAGARAHQPVLPMGLRILRWIEPRLMPYTVGTFASVFLFALMLNALRPHFQALAEASVAAREEATTVKIIYVGPNGTVLNQTPAPETYAAERAPYNDESPSLNPRGALAELTRSHVHKDEGDDDMIVVTDIFSDGRASLADVVLPPRDRQMLNDFQDALQKDAAFVPASYDRRPDTMRVVFVLQTVGVPERNF
jgi:hypothetical protein